MPSIERGGKLPEQKSLRSAELGKRAYVTIRVLKNGLAEVPEFESAQQKVPPSTSFTRGITDYSVISAGVESGDSEATERFKTDGLILNKSIAGKNTGLVVLKSRFTESGSEGERTFIDGHVVVRDAGGIQEANTAEAFGKVPEVFPEFYPPTEQPDH
jgi:hypothetical protein